MPLTETLRTKRWEQCTKYKKQNGVAMVSLWLYFHVRSLDVVRHLSKADQALALNTGLLVTCSALFSGPTCWVWEREVVGLRRVLRGAIILPARAGGLAPGRGTGLRNQLSSVYKNINSVNQQ